MTQAAPALLPRLSAAKLRHLPEDVARPAYDRGAVSTGIVHLGIGAFHRAHQAVYTDEVLAEGDGRWGISAASLRSPDTRDALEPQDGLYTLAVRSDAGERLRVVGSVREVLVAPESPARLLDRLSDPRVAIVSLTVTEKGYCHDPAAGTLDEDHPDIRHDLENPERPRTATGFLVAAIARRRKEDTAPFAVLSCDNLPANGRTTHRILSRHAALLSPDLGAYVAGEVACPDTMVDRIVPATTPGDRAGICGRLGMDDAWPVVTEPFTQWVIEDRFPMGRPAWDTAGAEFVADVAPYEAMKLRLLNGAHSAIAYLGYLGGCETVADAMADPGIAAFAEALMEDAAQTLAVPPGADVAGYRRALVARFRNGALRHRTWQIAMDGSQKLPQRLLGTARDRLAAGLPVDRVALAVAAWMRYAAGVDEAGRPIDVRDPLGPELGRIAANAGPAADRLAPAFLELRAVFGDDLPHDPRFRQAVGRALDGLVSSGARSMAAAYAGGGNEGNRPAPREERP